MTTNHPERLDPALTRPGRVDMELELELTNKDINNRLFCAIFMRDNISTDGMPAEDGTPTEDGTLAEERTPAEDGDSATLGEAEYKIMLTKLATEFADKLPEKEFSAAEIQSFLMEYRQSPHKAVENVEAWVVKTREGKRQMKRADSWVH